MNTYLCGPPGRALAEKEKEVMFVRPKKLIRTSGTEALGYVDIRTLAEGMCRYDLNEQDVAWLQMANEQFSEMGESRGGGMGMGGLWTLEEQSCQRCPALPAVPPLDEITMERVMEEFEHRCHENMTHAMETEEGLGIEYDEDVVCDVCQSPDGEDNNEMVFCDKCNICVHQVRGGPHTGVNVPRCAPERRVSPPGLLRHPEGPEGQLALPDLRPRHPTQMPAVSQEGWRHEADAERDQVGPRQLCLVDSRGEGQRSLVDPPAFRVDSPSDHLRHKSFSAGVCSSPIM